MFNPDDFQAPDGKIPSVTRQEVLTMARNLVMSCMAGSGLSGAQTDAFIQKVKDRIADQDWVLVGKDEEQEDVASE
ncbi:hypothetical protein H2203_005736 [Taxawa tesnikishii (nom. ined.)]|nr:hypothetical protein H2203_005736 [Dothideales sp. JES 119]